MDIVYTHVCWVLAV